MVLVNVWTLPLLTAFFVLSTVVSCYVLGVLNGLHPADWSAISDISKLPYQQSLYAELSNITALLGSMRVCLHETSADRRLLYILSHAGNVLF
ncbi:hypothetical protein L596_006068 [Steinernema carpocapsae]|uniref:Uncharacterized protein n=1 Tax=Steinernema carpocapsae TaxID=34508 RepID=A0A4V6I8U4_STECR|nr:hypothetical protein L596_006068 [Steinernema carpocapsae]